MLDTKVKLFCGLVALGLSGCSTIRLTTGRENVFNTNVIFVKGKGIPISHEAPNTNLLLAIKASLEYSSNIQRINSICATCPNFDYHEPVCRRLSKVFNSLGWMGNKSFCSVDCYEEAEKEVQKITPGTLFVIVHDYYVFWSKFFLLWGHCRLKVYKYNESFNPNLEICKKNPIARLIYDKTLDHSAHLKNGNHIFGIDENVKQWYGKLPEHIENFAEAFAQDCVEAFKD